MSSMIRWRHNSDTLFIFLVWLAARTVHADALETKAESTPGGHQNIQSDPHYDPHTAFPWGADTVSDDDPPFGIIRRRGGKGSDASQQLPAGRGRQERSRVQEPESVRRARLVELVEEGAGGKGKSQRYTTDRWRGDIETFLADRKMGRVNGVGSQLPLRVTQLEQEIRRESLTIVDLTALPCPAHECPRFATCPQNFSSEFRACTNSRLSHLATDPSRDPINCPALRDGAGHDPACSHKTDTASHHPYLARISVLEDVYVSWGGHTFDAQNLYNQEGCSKMNYFNYSVGTPVSVFKEVVNLAHGHGYAFYHGVIEVFPLFLLIADLMPHVKGIPIAQRIQQEILYDPVGQLLVGLSVEEYNGFGVLSNELFFAHRVFVPQKQQCGHPSKALWHVLRKNHFIPPDGVPMLNPNWTVRTPQHVAKETNGYPADWTVVLGKRYGERAVEQSDEIEAALRRLFTPNRVQIFDGEAGILEAKAMFNRARLFVTPHGALCVNMVFMPFGGHVFEMRPRDYPNPCFHHLAEVCELQFYLVMGNGTKHTNIGVDVPEVVRTLEMIKGRMEKEEEETAE